MTNARSLANFATGIGTEGAVLTVDNTNNRIGIATTNPQNDLQVGLGITMEGDTGQVTFVGVVTASSFSGSLDASTAQFTGDVGIGTINPQQKLDVRGNVTIGIDQVSGNPGTTVGVTTIRGHHVNSDSDYAELYFSNSKSAGGGTPPTASIRAARSGDNFGTNLSFYTNSTGSTGDGSERVRITSAGRVGIGTDDPSRRLQVQANGSTPSALFGNSEHNNSIEVTRTGSTGSYFQVQTYTNICNVVGGPTLTLHTSDPVGSASTERLRITSAGNVSIQNDSGKFTAGAGDDLQIYHNGNNFIEATNGSLFIRGSDLVLEDAGGNDYITCSDGGTGGTVTLKHLGSAKLATSSAGVTVTGTLNATTDVTINGTSAATTGKAIAMAMLFG